MLFIEINKGTLLPLNNTRALCLSSHRLALSYTFQHQGDNAVRKKQAEIPFPLPLLVSNTPTITSSFPSFSRFYSPTTATTAGKISIRKNAPIIGSAFSSSSRCYSTSSPSTVTVTEKKSIWAKVKEGLKLFVTNVRISTGFAYRLYKGETLERRERKLFFLTIADMVP
eukprot:Pgem_evm1s4220